MSKSRIEFNSLNVTDFGPIVNGRVQLRPLTVFVGPSNTGKSFMAGLIYALHGSFRANSDIVQVLHARGNLSYRSLLTPLQATQLTEENLNLLFGWVNSEFPDLLTDLMPATLHEEQDQLIELPESVADLVLPYLSTLPHWNQDFSLELARCFGTDRAANLVRYAGKGTATLLLRNDSTVKCAAGIGYKVRVTSEGSEFEASIPVEFRFWASRAAFDRRLPVRWRRNPSQLEEDAKKDLAISLLLALADEIASKNFGPLRRQAYFLPADRTGVMHAHQVVTRAIISGASRTALRSGTQMPSISGVLGDFLEQLVAFAGSLGRETGDCHGLASNIEDELLHGAVRAVHAEVEYPSFVYRPEGWNQDLPLMNASSMVSELAPVVLYLRHLVQPGNLLIIEEPEAHLHPEMQAKFTRFLVAAVQSGIRILITTHSEWILEELANLVRLSELPFENRDGIEDPEIALSPEQLGAWFFEPSKDAGGSVIREISLDEETATFPAGFGLVTEALYNRWVEISTRIQEE